MSCLQRLVRRGFARYGSRVRALATWISSFALLAACGGGAAMSEPGAASAGSERTASAPSGPPPSFLPAGTKVLLRLDVARIRRSPLAPDIASAIRATTSWQALAGDSGADPVRDFDAILVGADALYTDRRIVVLRHPHTEADVRRRVLALAIDRGAPAEWRDVDGCPAVRWPMRQTSLPYSLVLTAPHELVLAPDDELPRIAAVARDHAARRALLPSGGDVVLEPALAMREQEVATLRMDVPPPRRDGYPDPPQRVRVELDEREDGDGVALAAHAEFDDAAKAETARAWLEGQRQTYASQVMVRAIGMHRPLEEARIVRSEAALDIGATLSAEEIRRLLGLIALSQLAAGR